MAQDHPYVGRQHLHIGHEATGAGVVSALSSEDLFHTNHRNHGYLIARGADPGRALAEIMGRKDGLNGGRGEERSDSALVKKLNGRRGTVIVK